MPDSEIPYQLAVLNALPERDVLLLAVGIILTNDRGELLLHQQADKLWHLPGGHVNPGESLAQAAARETWEETGLTLLDLTLWTVVSGVGAHIERQGRKAYYVTALFRSSSYEGQKTAGEESLDVAWFPLNALPTATTGTVRQVAKALQSGAIIPMNFELPAGKVT